MEQTKRLILSKTQLSQDCFIEIYLIDHDQNRLNLEIEELSPFGHLLKFTFNYDYNYLDFISYLNTFIKSSHNVSRETLLTTLNEKVQLIQTDQMNLKNVDDFNSLNPIRKVQVQVKNPHGLHARPTTILNKISATFNSKIWIKKSQSEIVNAEDFLQVLTLEIKHNDLIEILAQGDDSIQALNCLKEAFQNELSDEFYKKLILNM